MTNGKRRRMSLFLLGLCLVLIGAIGSQMWRGISAERGIVTYGINEISPVEREVCAGGAIHYPVSVVVTENRLPTQAEIAEAWCKIGPAGICFGVQPGGMDANAKRLPLLRPKDIKTIAVRKIPVTLSPGEWELWHSSADTNGSVDAYIVGPVTIKVCENKP